MHIGEIRRSFATAPRKALPLGCVCPWEPPSLGGSQRLVSLAGCLPAAGRLA